MTFGITLAFFVAFKAPNFKESLIHEKSRPTRLVTDRNGRILRYLPDEKGSYNVWKNIQDFPDVLIHAVLIAEDRNFFYHPGFDPLAILRATYTNIKSGRTISGASTISQQVVRLLNPRPRTYYSKAIEFLENLKLEYQLSKKDILELYLNLVPMGGPLRGVGIASLIYFHKDISVIGVSECVCLAIIPRAPTRLDPNRPSGRNALLSRAHKLVHTMAQSTKIRHGFNEDLATKREVCFYHRDFPNEAPHFVDYALIDKPQDASELRTTLDLDLQKSIEGIFKSHASRLRRLGISQCAALVADAETREILAMIGSLNYADEAQGYNNGAISYRSAGSTLKPFLYALALSQGYSDASEIPDTLRNYKGANGDYVPLNANRNSYGPVSLRSALGNSLNLPAIKMIQHVKATNFYNVLQRLGLISEMAHGPVDTYGLGLAVGAIEIRLYDLVQAYACLAEGGMFRSLRMKPDQHGYYKRIFSESVASEITDILSDPLARILTFGNPTYFDFGFPVAVKTGTSSGYRDAWAVAYTPKHVIGVWAGNFNGSPMRDALGGSSCGPIIKEILSLLISGSPSNMQDEFSRRVETSHVVTKKPGAQKALNPVASG
ncbi:MAG: penicillin-binding protein 1C, partial [Desulfomonilaceae bacterium]